MQPKENAKEGLTTCHCKGSVYSFTKQFVHSQYPWNHNYFHCVFLQHMAFVWPNIMPIPMALHEVLEMIMLLISLPNIWLSMVIPGQDIIKEYTNTCQGTWHTPFQEIEPINLSINRGYACKHSEKGSQICHDLKRKKIDDFFHVDTT